MATNIYLEKLHESLYGLRKATSDWYARQHVRLMTFDPNVYRSMADPCFYYKICEESFSFLLAHVDDNACTYSDQYHFDRWLDHIKGDPNSDDYLDVKLLGDVTRLLQMRIVRTMSKVCQDHERQITQPAADYGVADCKLVLTPVIVRTDLQKSLEASPACIQFTQQVGSLL